LIGMTPRDMRFRRNFHLSIGLILLLFVFATALFILAKDGDARYLISDGFSPLLNILAVLSLSMAGWVSWKVSKRLSLGWWLLAGAQLSFAIGDMLWAFFELVLQREPGSSVVDFFYLLFYLLLFAGMVAFPLSRVSLLEMSKRLLDIGIVFVSSALGLWTFLIGPLANSLTGSTGFDQFIALAYPVGDLVILSALLILLYDRAEMHSYSSIWFLALGIGVMIQSDVIYSYQSLVGTYTSGSWIDLGWWASYLCFFLAGAIQILVIRDPKTRAAFPVKIPFSSETVSNLLTYLPYAYVVGSYVVLQLADTQAKANSFVTSMGVGGIIGLVLLRQIFSLNENHRLVKSLQKAFKQVKDQAVELEQANQVLKLEIIERERIEHELTYLSLHDHLTGLANRALFVDRLDHHVVERMDGREKTSHMVLFIDLDNFKNINDTLGHSFGDAVIIEVARRIKSCTRAMDTVARFGGDEFVVLLEGGHDDMSVSLIADRIQQEIQRVILINGQSIYASCSIGIVQGIEHYSSSEEIIRDADIAMYRAKLAGKARKEFFLPEMREEAASRLERENKLRQAANNHEWILY
jgi:diguanylate cyclase